MGRVGEGVNVMVKVDVGISVWVLVGVMVGVGVTVEVKVGVLVVNIAGGGNRKIRKANQQQNPREITNSPKANN